MLFRKNINVYFIFSLLSILIIFAYYLFDVLLYQGFNPSDEGVIQAQAYRLLQGEIPHKDFISIRPVFSGIFHLPELIFSKTPILFGRYVALFQYLIYSFFAIAILRIKSIKLFIAMFLIAFVMNISNYNIFPWTTIDALFWGLGGLFFYSKFKQGLNGSYLFLTALFLLFSVLSRQSFVFPAIVLFIIVVYKLKRNKQLRKLWFVLLACFPIYIYLFVLIKHQVFDAFLSQLTGRSELIETGIIRYVAALFKSHLFPLHVSVLLIATGIYFKNKRKKNSISLLIEKHSLSIKILNTLYFSLALIFIPYYFFISPHNVVTIPFELFYILIVLLIVNFSVIKKECVLEPVLLLLLFVWTSSISLGDNSPIFTMGVISTLILYVFVLFLKAREYIPHKYNWGFLIYAIMLFIFSLKMSSEVNYRDLNKSNLTEKLSKVNYRYGNIHTGKNTFAYLDELNAIFIDNKNSGITCFPNNAFCYSFYNQPSGLNIDWPQPEEYVGNEQVFMSDLSSVIFNKTNLIVLDKYNVKDIAKEKKLLDKSKYPYIELFNQYMHCDSTTYEHFYVYKQKKTNL